METIARELNIEIGPWQESLEKYSQLLRSWNEKMNLTAIVDEEEILLKHFLDSAMIFRKKISRGAKVIDIGTGAGFPGMVMAILRPDLEVTLMDSLRKRIVFLEAVAKELGLSNVIPIHHRAEEMARLEAYREHYDVACSRAVAELNTLVEYDLPFVKPGGFFIAMKAKDPREELQHAKKAIQILGGQISSIDEYELPGTDMKRSLIIIKKVRLTPKKYPRGGGKPRKNPL